MLKFLIRGALALALGFGFGTANAAPLEAYGSLPSIESVVISPDGSALALIVTIDDERRIIVKSLTGPVLASAVVGHRKVRNVQWAGADHVVVEASITTEIKDTTYVDEQWQAVSLNVRTGHYIQLPDQALDTLLNVVWGRLQPGADGKKAVVYTPLYVTVAGNMQYKSGHMDLYKIDLDTGLASRVQMGDNQTYGYLVRPDGAVVAKASYKNNEATNDATWTLSLRRGSSWQEVDKTTDARNTPELWGMSPDGQSVIIDTWDKQNALWRPTSVTLSDGKVGDYIGPPRKQGAQIDEQGVVLGFTYRNGELVEYDFLEPRLKALWPAYRNAFKGQQVWLTSWTPDFSKLILFVTSSNSAGLYYIADTKTKRVDPIGSPYPKLAPADVANVKLIEYKAADGLTIQAVLTTPKGRAEANLPLVVLPHGGPQGQDDVTFDWWAQAIASRGYAVLQPNFRGSTNLDHAFMEAGNGEWGGKMQTDLSDGVAFLAKAGTVDPKRVCIFGGSYGGYAALAGVALQKGVYRCAVSLAGPSDLAGRLHDEILKYGEKSSLIRYRKRVYGVQSESDPKLKAISPALHARDVESPVMLIHGKDDTVVPFSESQKMASALKAAGKPYEFVTLNGEDHWLSNGATRKQMLTAGMAFIEKYNPPN
ncbi:MAG: S9 family peptidase [bacterium]|nr:S9 family peptidase [bacterium]